MSTGLSEAGGWTPVEAMQGPGGFRHRRSPSGGDSNSSGHKAWSAGLVYNKTFIDVESDRDSSLSPRASSDPGSEPSSSFWEREKNYVEDLSDKWSISQRHGPSSDTSSKSDGPRNFFAPLPAAATAASSSNERPFHLNTLSNRDLWNHMTAKTNNITRNLRWKGHKEALTVIEELPEQVGEALMDTATKMIDHVTSEVAVMQTIIENDGRQVTPPPQGARQAVRNLQAIPDIIMEHFEASVVKAKDIVRSHVDGVLEDIASMPTEEMVCEMRKIPDQVQQIADQAVKVAVEGSKEQAKQRLDAAFWNLEEGQSAALFHAKLRMLNKIPTVRPVSEEVASNVVADKVEQVVAVVKETEVVESTIANRVVADTLLRAKAGQVEPNQPNSATDKINPGSVGHPQLCPRPCLYYVAGQCSNGMKCDFCHMPHDKRPAHLDKRHREMLKKMPFSECVTLALPLLREKVMSLGLGQHVVGLLEFLEKHAMPEAFPVVVDLGHEGYPLLAPGLVPAHSPKSNASTKHSRALLVAMKNMSIRALLTTLHRAAALQEPAACQEIYTLIQELRGATYLFQDDLARQLGVDISDSKKGISGLLD